MFRVGTIYTQKDLSSGATNSQYLFSTRLSTLQTPISNLSNVSTMCKYILKLCQEGGSVSPVSQSDPVNPAAHVQVNWLMPSTQVAPFWHGLLLHSSISEKGI